MNCPSCHAQLDDAAKFCGICGARLEGAAPPPAASPPAQARPAGKAGGGLSQSPRPAPSPMQAALPVGGMADGSDPYLGVVLNNRFRIDSKLGEGGFGAVYRGTQLGIGRDVALKLLHPEMTRDQNLVARFRREGVVLCSLRDAHTITTYDFDQTPDGTLYIAMELLEGRSLHEVFHSEAPIEWQRMLKIISEMCTSLYEAHQSGIVHRDLKPENINLEKRPGNPEFVKILDFGIAKVMRGDGSSNQSPQLTATGQTLGTLEYMSPEQLMGKELDGRSDIYALGVVTYELITGRLPFPDAVGPAALISAQLRSVPEPPSAALPSAPIPPGVDALVLKMLEKDRKNRFDDVMALQRAVEEVQRSGGAVPVGLGGGAVRAGATVLARPSAANRAVGSGGSPTPQPQPQMAPPVQQSAPAPVPSQPAAPRVPHYQQPQGKPQTSNGVMSTMEMLDASKSSRLWLWVILAMAAIGGAVGAFFALK